MDGFSPNLNKHLHIGHFSNLVLGKAFKSLGICENTVSIYGDTLKGDISSDIALAKLNQYLSDFEFSIDKKFLASEMIYHKPLIDGTGEYQNTKIFEIGDQKIVGVKSDGSTSYFYQDVALAEMLNDTTLYLTGKEQTNHFELLKMIYPDNINHIGLGLVKLNSKKMSSRMNNVIFMQDIIDELLPLFDNNIHLVYNVFAGMILKSRPSVDKNVNMDIVSNPKESAGLYISYTMARLNSAGCVLKANEGYVSTELKYSLIKAKTDLKPNILFEALVEHCRYINSLYDTITIKGNEENRLMFQELLGDLVLGSTSLGLFVIDKV
jgi:arginyl-tRNA synthetase